MFADGRYRLSHTLSFVWSRSIVPVELTIRYTTADIVLDSRLVA